MYRYTVKIGLSFHVVDADDSRTARRTAREEYERQHGSYAIPLASVVSRQEIADEYNPIDAAPRATVIPSAPIEAGGGFAPAPRSDGR